MNQVILIGRLVREPDVRSIDGGQQTCSFARYTIAVDRKFKRDGEQSADFINCVAFGKNGEFVQKFLHKGMKIAIIGRIQTGSYTDSDGVKRYTTDIVVESHEFCESKGSSEGNAGTAPARQNPSDASGFMGIPDDIEDGELPFN